MEENAVSRGYLQEEFRLFHNRDTLGAVTVRPPESWLWKVGL